MNKQILIIEDDNDINRMLQILLKQNGYDVIAAYSGTEGLLVHGENISLVLLDLMLPGRSGEDIICELKQKHNVPVIVMSAIHDVNKKVDLFSLGADDYVTKPFHNDELLARISARMRTSPAELSGSANSPAAKSDKLGYKDIEIDKSDFSVKCAGKSVELSRHEFALLCLLMENPNRTCTKSMIYDSVWDYENSADDNTLNVHISKLRKKLKECNPDAEYIETVWGIGYRLKK
jgi:DNA-binding response OmpR family regulator